MKQELNSAMIQANLKALSGWMEKVQKSASLEALYIPSVDIFFNEYTPMGDCLRIFLSGFTGSVAEMLALPASKPRLYVDGRYYEQADREVDSSLVAVVKVPYGIPLKQVLLEDLQNHQVKNLGILGDRTSSGMARDFESKGLKLRSLNSQELGALLKGFTGHDPAVQCEWAQGLPEVSEKIARLLQNDDDAWLLTAPDSVAWVSNARAYQFPFQATFAARALVTKKGVTLFHRPSVTPPAQTHPLVSWRACALEDVPHLVAEMLSPVQKKHLHVHRAAISYQDSTALERECQTALIDGTSHVVNVMASKVQLELNAFERSFERSDRAIWQSLEWLHAQAKASQSISERQWSDQVWSFYQAHGCRELSFKTISGFGPHSSIIHYSTPSAQAIYRAGELALLDSGGHFGHGICTDTTRAIVAVGAPSVAQKRQYTLVLKGLLHGLNAVFPVGAPGHFIDSLARAPMRRHGFDYAHGTGHGVGVAVHEAGVSFTPQSQVPMSEGRVGSLEPGIYLPGEGGVRLENIVIIEKHPTLTGMLRFKNLVWIGFQESLVERGLMTDEELRWFAEYQSECLKRGRALTF